MKKQIDIQIEACRAQQRQAEIKSRELANEIAYLYLQEGVCYEKIILYRNKGDVAKELLWELLADNCEDMYLAKQKEQKEFEAEASKLNEAMIQLLNRSIAELLQPWRELEEYHATRARA